MNGVLPMALASVASGRKRLAVAEASGNEAALVPGAEVAVVANLAEMVAVLRGEQLPRWAEAISPDVDLTERPICVM